MADKVKAVAIGVGPGASFIFGVLAGGSEGLLHWVFALLGLLCVAWLSFVLLVIAVRVWRHEEQKPPDRWPRFIGSMQGYQGQQPQGVKQKVRRQWNRKQGQ